MPAGGRVAGELVELDAGFAATMAGAAGVIAEAFGIIFHIARYLKSHLLAEGCMITLLGFFFGHLFASKNKRIYSLRIRFIGNPGSKIDIQGRANPADGPGWQRPGEHAVGISHAVVGEEE
jgi:hypothetical protein